MLLTTPKVNNQQGNKNKKINSSFLRFFSNDKSSKFIGRQVGCRMKWSYMTQKIARQFQIPNFQCFHFFLCRAYRGTYSQCSREYSREYFREYSHFTTLDYTHALGLMFLAHKNGNFVMKFCKKWAPEGPNMWTNYRLFKKGWRGVGGGAVRRQLP